MARIPLLWSLPLVWTLSAGAGLGRAEPILDQAFDPGPPGPGSIGAGVGGGFDRAQTFTVGIGGLLTRVEVLTAQIGSPTVDLRVDVRPTRGGVPLEDEAALAALTVPAAGLPTTQQFVGFDLTPFGVFVAPGDVLALVLRAPSPDAVAGVFGRVPDPYGRGAAFFRSPVLRSWTPLTAVDFPTDVGFRTFVDPAIIPEPYSLALLVTGSIGLLGYVRIRRIMAA